MPNCNFIFDDKVKALGVTGAYLTIEGVSNAVSHPDFDVIREDTLRSLRKEMSPDFVDTDPVLQSFRELHSSVGMSNRKNPSSPENLLSYFLKSGQLPRVNLLVDIYNLVSIKTRLALGAHDIASINGNVQLRLTDGTERFVPLGSSVPKDVRPGVYSYVDDSNEIICYLEVRQVEKTKVVEHTQDVFYIIQGNARTERSYVQQAVVELLQLTKRFCGGTERILYPTQAETGL